jgi:hypothetical protein
VLDVPDGPFSGVNGSIDVTDRTVAKAFDSRIVLFARHIGTHLSQELERLVQMAGRSAGTSTFG